MYLPNQTALLLSTVDSRTSLEIVKEVYIFNIAVDAFTHREVSYANCVIAVSLYSVVVPLTLFSSVISINSTSTLISTINNRAEITHLCLIPLLILKNSVWRR